MHEQLVNYKAELEAELEEILAYWIQHSLDDKDGFIGRIAQGELKYPDAPKGSVLISRILWSFSAGYNLTGTRIYRQMAQRAFKYLQKYFIDQDYGGVYWTVSPNGEPLDTKKQIYALAFAIYGLSEYYIASGDEEARKVAIGLYNDIVRHSYDARYGGYLEALSRDWKEMNDIRLSEKDANERKSMNTHLHVLEGFANLYHIWPDEGLKVKLTELVQIFLKHIISKNTHDLILFFEDDWTPKSSVISYGHNVEAAWLLEEATQTLGDNLLLTEVKNWSLELAMVSEKGVDKDGGTWYEYEAESKHLIKQKHWWVQAEAMVGFFNAWQNTGDTRWLQRSLNSWAFVNLYIKDKNSGEWFWGVNEDGSTMSGEDKVGIWKCPYHNSRACIEIIYRIKRIVCGGRSAMSNGL